MLVSEIGALEKFGCEMDRVSSDKILMIAQYCFRKSDILWRYYVISSIPRALSTYAIIIFQVRNFQN